MSDAQRKPRLRRIAGGIVLIAGLATATGPAAAFSVLSLWDRLFGTTGNETETFAPSGLDGIWRSRGYGWIWSIRGDRIEVMDVASRTCSTGKRSNLSVSSSEMAIHLDESGQSFHMREDGEPHDYRFDRINELPAICTTLPRTDPIGVLNAIDDLFSTHYPFFKARNLDWPVLMDEARSAVTANTNETELFQILSNLLSHVHDDHVSLSGQVDGQDRYFDARYGRTNLALSTQAAAAGINRRDFEKNWRKGYWRNGVAEEILGGDGQTAARDRMQFGMLDDAIGYLNILSMEGFSRSHGHEQRVLTKALDKAMAQFEEARAVIVDITMNDGGFDRYARQIASRFAAAPTIAYSKFAGDFKNSPPQALSLKPSSRARFTGPVYVMTSELTVSAAEVFTLAMRALPNATHVGESTRGSLSDILYKPLPNGWNLGLSNEVYLDADNVSWEARGIRPEIEIEIFSSEDVTRGHVAAVNKVAELARQRF